ncbi:hypothetical protein lerEdw1_009550 [Lerista edwardsae]|nr:hypothetical protein lerEdw1_009550 [Lerista edwardsae]
MALTRIISYVMTGANVFLHVVVHTSPAWTVYRPYTSPNLVGLWIICSKEWGCNPPEMNEANMNTVRAFMATALASSFVALIWSVDWEHIVHCNFVFVPKALMTAIFNFFAGICVFVSLMVFEFTVIQEFEEVHPRKKWAYYLSMVICILSFLTGILDLVSYKYMLWGMGPSNIHVAPETEDQIAKQNAQVPRLL